MKGSIYRAYLQALRRIRDWKLLGGNYTGAAGKPVRGQENNKMAFQKKIFRNDLAAARSVVALSYSFDGNRPLLGAVSLDQSNKIDGWENLWEHALALFRNLFLACCMD